MEKLSHALTLMISPLTLCLPRRSESLASAWWRFSARKTDPPLSKLGLNWGARQAKALREVRLSALSTSPLLWFRQTAEIMDCCCGFAPVLAEPLEEINVSISDGESVVRAIGIGQVRVSLHIGKGRLEAL